MLHHAAGHAIRAENSIGAYSSTHLPIVAVQHKYSAGLEVPVIPTLLNKLIKFVKFVVTQNRNNVLTCLRQTFSLLLQTTGRQ